MMHESMDTGDGDDSSVMTAANPMTEAEGAAAEVIRKCLGDRKISYEDAMTIEDGRLTGIEFNEMSQDLKALPEREFKHDDGNGAEYERAAVRDQECATAIVVAELREAPDVAEANGTANRGEHKGKL